MKHRFVHALIEWVVGCDFNGNKKEERASFRQKIQYSIDQCELHVDVCKVNNGLFALKRKFKSFYAIMFVLSKRRNKNTFLYTNAGNVLHQTKDAQNQQSYCMHKSNANFIQNNHIPHDLWLYTLKYTKSIGIMLTRWNLKYCYFDKCSVEKWFKKLLLTYLVRLVTQQWNVTRTDTTMKLFENWTAISLERRP